ncbi:hypothetical protein [uncultured Brachyspira sp.]|uniref:hypothetical protein n=1 Tax=uncultured Brachyspira sp. TaxID=221953 RepID=UPI0025DF760A|nr:hypothetical protein [uncultured Brachyspira sp.]
MLTYDNNNEYNILYFLDNDKNKKEVKINTHSTEVKIKYIENIIDYYKNCECLTFVEWQSIKAHNFY